MWSKDSYLKQIPHFTKELIEKCKEKVGDLVTLASPDMSLCRGWRESSTSWSSRTRSGTSCST